MTDKKKIRISKDDLSSNEEKGGSEEETKVLPEKGEPAVSVPKGSAKTQSEEAEKPAKPKAKKGFAQSFKGKREGKGGEKGGPSTKGKSKKEGGNEEAPDSPRGIIRRQHPMVLVGSGIALFAVCFAGTFFLIDFLKTDRQRTEDALDYSTKAVIEVQKGVVRARGQQLPYSYLQDLASASEDLSEKVDDRKREYLAEVQDKPQLTEPAVAVMNAEIRYLRGFGRLDEVKDYEIGRKWRRIERGIRNAVTTINTERSTIAQNISDDASLLPTNVSLDRSVGAADRVVLAANAKIQGWLTVLRQIRNQCERVKAFDSGSSGLVAEYRGQRDETGSFLGTPDLFWRVAVEGMRARADQRDDLAQRMSSLTAPASAAGSWSGMIQLVGESATSLRQAADQFEDGTIDPATTWPESQVVRPAFDARSQQISSSVDSTAASLETGVAVALQSTCGRKRPPRPAI